MLNLVSKYIFIKPNKSIIHSLNPSFKIMKITTRLNVRTALLLLITASLSITGFAQKPNFSGTWKLNDSKSKMNPEFTMAPGTLIVEHEGNTLTAESIADFQGQEFRQKNSYTLDGSESKNEGWQGMELISIATWDDEGKSVIIKTNFEMQNGGELTITQIFGMDGGSLWVRNEVEGAPVGGGEPEKWVFDKQ